MTSEIVPGQDSSMATLTDIGRSLTIRIDPALLLRLEQDLAEINTSQSLRFQGRNLTKEAYINALLVHHLGLEDKARDKQTEKCIRLLENQLQDPPPKKVVKKLK